MTCPICKKEFVEPAEAEKRFTPFCSDRCRLIDLGRWLTGKYQIPVEEKDESGGGEDDPDFQPRRR